MHLPNLLKYLEEQVICLQCGDEASYTYAQINLDSRLSLIESIADRLRTRVTVFETCRLTLDVTCPSG